MNPQAVHYMEYFLTVFCNISISQNLGFSFNHQNITMYDEYIGYEFLFYGLKCYQKYSDILLLHPPGGLTLKEIAHKDFLTLRKRKWSC